MSRSLVFLAARSHYSRISQREQGADGSSEGGDNRCIPDRLLTTSALRPATSCGVVDACDGSLVSVPTAIQTAIDAVVRWAHGGKRAEAAWRLLTNYVEAEALGLHDTTGRMILAFKGGEDRPQHPRHCRRCAPRPTAASRSVKLRSSGSVSDSHGARAAAIRAPLLDRRTRHRAVGAEHAAVALPWAQERLALGAFVKEHAGVRGHFHLFLVPAVRASEDGVQRHGHACNLVSPLVVHFDL